MELYRNKYIIALGIFILLIVFAAGIKYEEIFIKKNIEEIDLTSIVTQTNSINETEYEEKYIEVYITGEVAHKGIYRLKENARVYEAIELANPLETANLDYINMAGFLCDGETIIVPSILNNEINDINLTISHTNKSKININRATAKELEQLPGIGPALAQRIVDYRSTNGNFNSIEDIKNVSGIGEKKYTEIKDKISIR